MGAKAMQQLKINARNGIALIFHLKFTSSVSGSLRSNKNNFLFVFSKMQPRL